MALLDFLTGLYDLYLVFVASPIAIWRWIRRWRRPTAAEQRLARTREMQRFVRHARFGGAVWLLASVAVGIGARSLGAGAIMVLLGFMFLPGMIEQRYERLAERLGAAPKD